MTKADSSYAQTSLAELLQENQEMMEQKMDLMSQQMEIMSTGARKSGKGHDLGYLQHLQCALHLLRPFPR